LRLKVIRRGFIRDYLRPEPLVNYLGRASVAPSETLTRDTQSEILARLPRATNPRVFQGRKASADELFCQLKLILARFIARSRASVASWWQRTWSLTYIREWIRQTMFLDAPKL
jgi:hypothetical protein